MHLMPSGTTSSSCWKFTSVRDGTQQNGKDRWVHDSNLITFEYFVTGQACAVPSIHAKRQPQHSIHIKACTWKLCKYRKPHKRQTPAQLLFTEDSQSVFSFFPHTYALTPKSRFLFLRANSLYVVLT